MMKRDGVSDGKNLAEKIKLPLTQTVFLPKEAMGVRYIDKVRANVFVEKISPMEQGFWLRGFFELTLEYQGVEGRGLCKHRVMLPLKVPVRGWPRGVEQGNMEAADFHAAVKHPIIKLLSPYVLEFSADLVLDYLGECRWQEDRLQPPAPLTPSRRSWQSNLPMPDEDKPGSRIESKIDHFFLGKAADNLSNEKPRLISSNGILDKDTSDKNTLDKSGRCAPYTEESGEHSLPIWQFEPREGGESEPTVQRVQSRIVEMPSRETVSEDMARKIPTNVERPVEKTVEKPVEKAVEKRVEKPVENRSGRIVGKGAVNPDPSLEQIYASRLNKNRFRSILTAAAISRLQARGENLTAMSEEIDSLVNGVGRENEKSAANGGLQKNMIEMDKNTEKRENIVKYADIGNGEDMDKSENLREVATIGSEEKEAVVAEEQDVVTEVSGGTVQEKSEVVSENVSEAVVAEEVREVAAETVAENADVENKEADLVTEGLSVVETVENAADVVEEKVENRSETAAEAESEAVSVSVTEAVEVSAESPLRSSGVEMVNNRGVRVRLAANSAPVKQVPPAAKTVGFSIKYYVVKPGDDAMSIALKHNISIERLRDANRLPEGELAAGTLLRIPR